MAGKAPADVPFKVSPRPVMLVQTPTERPLTSIATINFYGITRHIHSFLVVTHIQIFFANEAPFCKCDCEKFSKRE